MRQITLIQGEKGSGKSKFIHEKLKEIESEVEVIETVNKGGLEYRNLHCQK